MKKIKFIVLLCLLTVGLTSCFENVQDTVKNPLVETTVSIQQLPKDTVVVSIQDRTLYVFDDENNLKYVTVGIEDESFPISIFFFLIFTVMVFILGLIIGND